MVDRYQGSPSLIITQRHFINIFESSKTSQALIEITFRYF